MIKKKIIILEVGGEERKFHETKEYLRLENRIGRLYKHWWVAKEGGKERNILRCYQFVSVHE